MTTSPGLVASSVSVVSVALRVRFAWVSWAPFGRPVGARGVQDHSVIVVGTGTARLRGRAHGMPGQRGGQVGLGDLDDPRARLGGALGRLAGRRVPGEQHLRPRVAQVEGHFAALEQRVHRDHHRAGAERAEERDRERRHVRQHDRDPVPRRHPGRQQQRGGAGRVVTELGVAQHQVIHPQRGLVGVLGGGLLQQGMQVSHDVSQPGRAGRSGPQLHHARCAARP